MVPSNGHSNSAQAARIIAHKLIAEQSFLTRLQERQAKLRQEVEEYERRYRMESSAVRAAISAGTLQETDEVCRWLIKYDTLERSTASSKA